MNNIPLPFDLPPPDATPTKPTPLSRVPADDQTATPGQHTDLPLSLRGNGGSSRRAADDAEAATLEQLFEKLDRLLSIPAAPSLNDADHRAVERWSERAAAGLASRGEALKLVREVERLIADERRNARQVAYAEERIVQKLELARERAAGTHWKRRDSGRRAKQPTHVEVDPAAWRRARAEAARHGLGIGEFVGRLVAQEVLAPERGPISPLGQILESGRARIFARLAVERAPWEMFVARSAQARLTVARHVGLVVERMETQEPPVGGRSRG